MGPAMAKLKVPHAWGGAGPQGATQGMRCITAQYEPQRNPGTPRIRGVGVCGCGPALRPHLSQAAHAKSPAMPLPLVHAGRLLLMINELPGAASWPHVAAHPPHMAHVAAHPPHMAHVAAHPPHMAHVAAHPPSHPKECAAGPAFPQRATPHQGAERHLERAVELDPTCDAVLGGWTVHAAMMRNACDVLMPF